MLIFGRRMSTIRNGVPGKCKLEFCGADIWSRRLSVPIVVVLLLLLCPAAMYTAAMLRFFQSASAATACLGKTQVLRVAHLTIVGCEFCGLCSEFV
jgi:hypothetical protein